MTKNIKKLNLKIRKSKKSRVLLMKDNDFKMYFYKGTYNHIICENKKKIADWSTESNKVSEKDIQKAINYGFLKI